MLLANLSQNSQVRTKIRSMLPKKNLDVLVRAIDEFILYHQKVDREIFEGEEGEQLSEGFTQRLQVVVDRLKQAE